MRDVDVFVAYQFSKAKMSRSDREAAIQQAVDVVRQDMPSGKEVSLRWSSFDLESPGYVFPQIKEQIAKSAIFVADISELNLNVLLETGFALGLMEGSLRVTILLCHEDVDERKVPSDLLGMYVHKYNNDSFRHVLQREIKRALEQYIVRIEHEEIAQIGLPGFWGYKDGADVDIVCSELPSDDTPYYASPDDRNYLRYGKFADLDSAVHLHTNLVRLFPNVRIRDFTASEHQNADYNGLILIGGPAWNRKFRIFQDHLPICFEDRENEPDDVLVVLDSNRKPLCESLSGHIPRSLLRASGLLPYYHQYPAACCGDFLLRQSVSHNAAHGLQN